MSWFIFISSIIYVFWPEQLLFFFFIIIIITAPLFDTSCCVSSSVPTDALANKLFGAPEPSSIARSLPTTVPDSPNYRTPRTPRTPHRKDQTMTPRFYPVVKEGRPVDAKVRFSFPHGRALLLFFCVFFLSLFFIPDNPTRGSVCLLCLLKSSPLTLQTPRKRKTRHSSNPPMECHVGWVMDSREHRSRTASVR